MLMNDLVYGVNPVREVLTRQGRKPLELLLVRDPRNERLRGILASAQEAGVPVRFRQRRELDALVGHGHHQGAVLLLEPFSWRNLDEFEGVTEVSAPPLLLVLDGITDPHNMGALIRSAECFGAAGVVVPKDRSCPMTAVVEKAAAGALAHLSIYRETNLSRALEKLKTKGLWIFGLAGEGEQPICGADLTVPLALVVGSEGSGMRPGVRKHCDAILSIPMAGRLNSLNVSVAAGVALFEVVRQRAQDRPA